MADIPENTYNDFHVDSEHPFCPPPVPAEDAIAGDDYTFATGDLRIGPGESHLTRQVTGGGGARGPAGPAGDGGGPGGDGGDWDGGTP